MHAKGQVAHFKTPGDLPLKNIQDALNSALPKSIAIIKTEEAGPDFHSRFSAKSKIYEYNILNSKIPDPFLEKYSWRVPYKLDFNLIKKEAHFLLGRHDFKSFQASDSSSSSQSSLSSPRLSAAALAKAGKRESIRTISDIHIKKAGKRITVRIEGNGFLYNMVRNIVGTLIDVGRGYLSAGSMKKILKSKDRTKAGPTAPAKGLFLIKVKY